MTLKTKQGRTKRAVAAKATSKSHRIVIRDRAVQFFMEHAGFSYDPKIETAEQGKARCAQKLADAEAHAASKGWVFVWQQDPDGCIGCDCGSPDCACSSGAPHEVLYCLLKESDDGKVLASLSSICEPSSEYRRVVEAELALEVL